MIGYTRHDDHAIKLGANPSDLHAFIVLCENLATGERWHDRALARDCAGAEAAVRGASRICDRVLSVQRVDAHARLQAVA